MEDIDICFSRDKILVNMSRHMYDIVNKDNRWFYRMIYIDRFVHHYMFDMSYDIPDNCKKSKLFKELSNFSFVLPIRGEIKIFAS